MLKRTVAKLVRERLSEFPAVALVGPRQCGKTTLAKALAKKYFDMEQDADRVRLDLGWDDLIAGKGLVVLDEAQTWPALFSRLRGAIDAARKRNGRFLLLGSVAPSLMQQVSESLAGRLSVVELSPLQITEVGADKLDALWRCGGFPDGGILKTRAYPAWQQSYLELMVQRDLPNLGMTAKAPATMRLLRMLAALQGTTLNASKLGASLGTSYHTIHGYLTYLEGTYLLRALPPYEANIKKRLVRSPRLYIRDTGLLHSLLDVGRGDDLLSMPWVGASWEGFVIEQVISARQARGEDLRAYFFRTHDGQEVDLVLEGEGEREVLEIKLTSSPSPEHFEKLGGVAQSLKATRQVILSRTRAPQVSGSRWSTNLADYLARCSK